jgi:protein Tex
VVESCVNGVGVELNTASIQLLSYVSGLGPSLAKNIVRYRDQNGPFTCRKQLMKVPRLGEKAYQQSAGFLRIRNAENPLDASAVHPEGYAIVDQMARDLGVKVADLVRNEGLCGQIKLDRYVSSTIGMPTLRDILKELAKPGRDPRAEFEAMEFREGIRSMEDLEQGMTLPGIVTNITRFGAFVDVGVHQDGMVHISEMADRFIRDPAEVVKVLQKVTVRVMEVDRARKRISLSMKGVEQ